MRLRIVKELVVIKRTIEAILFQLKIEGSLRRAIRNVFSRKGIQRYRIEDGPWIKGTRYDMIRAIIFRKNGF